MGTMPATPIDPELRLSLMETVMKAGPADPTQRLILTTMVEFCMIHKDKETGKTTLQYRRGARLLARPFRKGQIMPSEVPGIVDEPIAALAEAGYLVQLAAPIPGSKTRDGVPATWQIVLDR